MDGVSAHYWTDCLINEFGSLPGVFASSPEARSRVVKGDQSILTAIEAVKAALLHVTTLRLTARPLLNNMDALYAYLSIDHAYCTTEIVRAFYLDVRLGLIKDEVISNGTLNEAPVYPANIIRRALELHAAGIIIVHNHPSGDAAPSQADVAITRAIALGCKPLDIRLYDHIVVSRGENISFRQRGLI